MSRHAARFLEDRRYRLGPQAQEYADRKYPSPLYTELVERQRRKSHRAENVREFATSLKWADTAARAGRCRDAAYALSVAKALGDDQADRLPNARREINAKIRMVERAVLDRAHCGTRVK